jgi:3-deoxy-D-manno-octulosonic-acid transferase
MKLLLYRALTFLAKPLARPVLAVRGAMGKEHRDPARRAERLGRPSVPRPDGLLFWFDAVSVGEGNSILPLIDFALEEYPGSSALVTTTTVTGAENMETKLRGRRAVHQFLPLDRRAYADGFLEYWQPTVGFFTDSDFWPNILLAARARGIPLILLNGRVSDRSHARWTRHRDASSELMSAFVYALAKSDDDARKLSGMGMKNVECVGNLKYGAPPPLVDRGRLSDFAEMAGGRPSWVAAVTHPGEEEIALRVHAAVREKIPGALLVIAPRHPNRGREIASMASAAGYETGLESERPITGSTAVYVSDVLGGLGLYYAYAGLVLVGGSLLETLDGHNPMEAAGLGAAVLSGPHVASFLETYDILKRDGAVVMVDGEDCLASEITDLLSNPARLAELRGRSLRVAKREAAVIDRAKEKLRKRLAGIVKS